MRGGYRISSRSYSRLQRRRSRRRELAERLLEWAIFGVLLAVVPIGIKWLAYLYERQPVSHEVLFGQGELLILAIGLAANALKDVVLADNTRRLFRLLILLFSLVTIPGGATIYALDRSAEATGGPPNTGLVVVVSLVLYPGALLVGCASTAKARR